MKKVIIFVLTIVLIPTIMCSCIGKGKVSQAISTEAESNAVQTTEPIPSAESNIIQTTEAIPSTTQLDVSSLSNEEFAKKVADDLSTVDVTFSVRSVNDSIAFLDAEGTDKINAHVGFADFGNSITLSFNTDGSEDECYFTLLHFLESDILNIDEDDQIDILAHYMVDKINYSKGGIDIKETIKENIRVILIQL